MRKAVPVFVIAVVVLLVALSLWFRATDAEAPGPAVPEEGISATTPNAELLELAEHPQESVPVEIHPASGESNGVIVMRSIEQPSNASVANQNKDESREAVRKNVIASIDSYFAAGFANDADAAAAVSKPGTSVSEQAVQIQTVKSRYPVLPIDVYWGSPQRVLAVSWLVEIEQPNGMEEGYLLFSLERDESGTWIISDVDFKPQDSAELDIDKFLETFEGELIAAPEK